MADVTDEVLETVASRLSVHTPPAGERLYIAGQAPTSLFLVEQGRISLTGDVEGEFGPGDLIAEPNLLAGRAHASTATVDADAWLWELSAADFERLCAMYAELRTHLGAATRTRLSSADQSRAVGLLKNNPLFGSLPDPVLMELAASLSRKVAPSGTRIFEASTPANAMFLVESGQVELLNQRGQPLARVSANEYFGEAGLSGADTYGVGARARGSTVIWMLRAEDVKQLAARFPILAAALAELGLESEPAAEEEHFAERYLRNMSLLAGLSNDQIHEVAGRLRAERFNAGEAGARRTLRAPWSWRRAS
jgi:CRP-like cAMP-binding protein